MAPVMMLGLIQQRLNTGLDETPSAGIERLLLTPHDGLRILVAVQVLLELLPGEGVELLNTRDGGVLEALVGAVLVQCSVHLAGTDDHAIDLVGFGNRFTVFWVWDDPLEV